jgi:hypothetical protein
MRVRLVFSIVLLLCLLAARPALADVAPPPPPAGAGVIPGAQGTQVRMEAERVVLEVQSNAYDQPASAVVNAVFHMRNMGSQAEDMQVRFPLNVLLEYQPDLEGCAYPLAYPEIQDFRAWVNGAPVPARTVLVDVADDFRGQPAKKVKCWADFPVTFPAGEPVVIEVQYSVQAYNAWDVNGVVEFPYVLVTGAGWHGTIGQAEVILRAPFDLTALTLMSASPETAQVQGRELRWLFEDFEPSQNVYATIINPGLWARVEREQATLAANPRDGEAWGRLGRWYKEANRMRRGWRWDAGAVELYRLSKEAYTQAVTLKPADADWHAGFADLLCWSAFFEHPGTRLEARDDLVRCADEARRALELNPNQALAKQIVQDLSTQTGWRDGEVPLVDLSGGRPVWTVLTTTPTARPEDTATPLSPSPMPPEAASPTPSHTPPAAPTALPSPTPEAISQFATATPAPAADTPTPEAPPAAPTQAPARSGPGICGAALLPLLGLAWRYTRR